LNTQPSVLFWPVGNPELETAKADAQVALENLRDTDLDVTAVEKMTWWEPTEIPALARKVLRQEFDLIVVFSATHGTVRCISAIGERFENVPKLVWSLPFRYSLATSAIAISYLRERGHSVKLLNHEPSDPKICSEIELVAKAGRSFRLSRKLKIGIIGDLSPLMISLPYDFDLLRKKLGPATRKIPIPLLNRTLKSVKNTEVADAVEDYKTKYDVKISDETLGKAVRFQLAVKKLVERYKLDGIALECWTNLFSKYGVNPCLGHLDDLVIGCEGDFVSLSGSLILQRINGVNPYLADILSVDVEKNTIELSHCSAPISLAKNPTEIKIGERTDPKSIGKTAFANFELKSGPVTLVRFFGRDLNKIHMTHGELKSNGNYWGGISMVLDSGGSAKNFLDNASGNHYLFTYGDIREELRLFAEWKGLELIES
jgi:L-fucose isomerase-like protein